MSGDKRAYFAHTYERMSVIKRKNSYLLLPVTILPYFALFCLAFLYGSTTIPPFQIVMERLFQNNIFYLFGAIVLFFLLAAGLSIFHFIRSLRRAQDALALAKTAVIIKLIQIPAYILIFLLGILLLITPFTAIFSGLLFLIDCLTLCLTGLITVAAAINAGKQGLLPTEQSLLLLLLQPVFCADVIAALLLYRKLRRNPARQ